jgi:hypothetical protein
LPESVIPYGKVPFDHLACPCSGPVQLLSVSQRAAIPPLEGYPLVFRRTLKIKKGLAKTKRMLYRGNFNKLESADGHSLE